jgi:hypothetical protein
MKPSSPTLRRKAQRLAPNSRNGFGFWILELIQNPKWASFVHVFVGCHGRGRNAVEVAEDPVFEDGV